jgi:glycosyltransferase involved in cell wall biosynthesis
MSAPRGTRLMMTTDTVGGVWTFATDLARGLGARGFQVLLVTLGPRPASAQRAMIAGYPGVLLIETDLALEWQDPGGQNADRARTVLAEIAAAFAPHVVHLNSFREATFGWSAPVIVVAHSCVNTWATACGDTNFLKASEWSAYATNVRAGLERAYVWLAPSFAFRDQIARQYQSPEKGHTIWNGAIPAGRRSEAKQPVVLAAGRVWDKAKNLPALTAVTSRLDWPVRIVGPFDGEGRRIPVRGCELLGELSHQELLREMKMASIFVSPALYEPFGLSVLEAATAGCALLLSDIPTFRELWDGAALFFNPRDADELTQQLRLLGADEVQRARLQRGAIERARQYPIRATIEAYGSLYAAALANNADRSLALRDGGMQA